MFFSARLGMFFASPVTASGCNSNCGISNVAVMRSGVFAGPRSVTSPATEPSKFCCLFCWHQRRRERIQPDVRERQLRVNRIIAREPHRALAVNRSLGGIRIEANGHHIVLRLCRQMRIAEIAHAQHQSGRIQVGVQIHHIDAGALDLNRPIRLDLNRSRDVRLTLLHSRNLAQHHGIARNVKRELARSEGIRSVIVPCRDVDSLPSRVQHRRHQLFPAIYVLRAPGHQVVRFAVNLSLCEPQIGGDARIAHRSRHLRRRIQRSRRRKILFARERKQLRNVGIRQLYIPVHRRCVRHLPVRQPDRPGHARVQIAGDQRRVRHARARFHRRKISHQRIDVLPFVDRVLNRGVPRDPRIPQRTCHRSIRRNRSVLQPERVNSRSPAAASIRPGPASAASRRAAGRARPSHPAASSAVPARSGRTRSSPPAHRTSRLLHLAEARRARRATRRTSRWRPSDEIPTRSASRQHRTVRRQRHPTAAEPYPRCWQAHPRRSGVLRH